MKKVLCYGDSNTWGQATFGGRIDGEKQWPNILQTLLTGYKVIQEGLSGRVAGDFDSKKPYHNGKSSYEVILRSTAPDIVIIALGTNDLKTHFNRSAQQIVDDLLWYEQFTRELVLAHNHISLKIIYVLPANFVPSDYFQASEPLRQEVIQLMKQTGQECLELPNLSMTDDGVHYSLEAHRQVAEIIHNKLKETADEA